MDNHLVTLTDFLRADKNLHAVLLQPYFADIQGHGARKVTDGLLVRPLFQQFADAKQEHDRSRRLGITAQNRHSDRRRIEYRYFDLSCRQCLYALPDVAERLDRRPARPDRIRQKNLGCIASHHSADQLLLIACIQLSSGILDQPVRHFHIFIVKMSELVNQFRSAAVITDDCVTRTLIHLGA